MVMIKPCSRMRDHCIAHLAGFVSERSRHLKWTELSVNGEDIRDEGTIALAKAGALPRCTVKVRPGRSVRSDLLTFTTSYY